jgi:flagellar hook-length control protein FliK
MLDSRTLLPTERAQRAAAHAKGASLLDALATKPMQSKDLSFGSVLSNTLSDRRAAPRAQEHAAAADKTATAPSRQAAGRKAAQRDRRRDAKDDTACASAEGQPQATDAPDRNDPAPADSQVSDAAAPEPKESPPADASQPPADAGVTPGATQQTAMLAAAGDAVAQSLAVAVDSSDAPAGSEQPAGTAGKWIGAVVGAERLVEASAKGIDAAAGTEQSAAAPDKSQSDKLDSSGLTPLQWMAQQQVAKLNARTVQTRGSIPVQPDSTDKQVPDSGAAEPSKQASPDKPAAAPGAPAVQQLMANLFGRGKSAPDALGVLKLPQDKPIASMSGDSIGSAATQGAVTQGHSVTADPTGLLNPSDGAAFAAVSQTHSPQSATHTIPAPQTDGQLNAALFAPADDNRASNMQRLAAMVHAKMGQGQSIARMQLQPPELGAVTAVIQLRQNKMDLKLEVANEAARDMVTDGLGRLRDSLQQQGISLDRATVSVAPRNEHSTGDQQQPAWTGHQEQPSGQFHPGQGDQQSDRNFTTSFAMDVPATAVAGQDGVATAATLQAVGLNVLA